MKTRTRRHKEAVVMLVRNVRQNLQFQSMTSSTMFRPFLFLDSTSTTSTHQYLIQLCKSFKQLKIASYHHHNQSCRLDPSKQDVSTKAGSSTSCARIWVISARTLALSIGIRLLRLIALAATLSLWSHSCTQLLDQL